MPKPYNPTTVSGKIVSKENQLKVLKALHLFGHLRRTELARFVWPNSTPNSAKIMCSRTTKILSDKKFILERPNSLGGRSLVLTSSGANALYSEGIDADAGYDLTSVSGPQFWHRTLGTCFLVEKSAQGHYVFTEHQLAKEKSELTRSQLIKFFEKAPDGVVLRSDKNKETWVDWVEVESSAKDPAEIVKMFNILNFTYGKLFNEEHGYKIGKLYIVYDTRQPHERTLGAVLAKYLQDNKTKISKTFMSNLVFVRCTISYPLVFENMEEVTPSEIFDLNY